MRIGRRWFLKSALVAPFALASGMAILRGGAHRLGLQLAQTAPPRGSSGSAVYQGRGGYSGYYGGGGYGGGGATGAGM